MTWLKKDDDPLAWFGRPTRRVSTEVYERLKIAAKESRFGFDASKVVRPNQAFEVDEEEEEGEEEVEVAQPRTGKRVRFEETGEENARILDAQVRNFEAVAMVRKGKTAHRRTGAGRVHMVYSWMTTASSRGRISAKEELDESQIPLDCTESDVIATKYPTWESRLDVTTRMLRGVLTRKEAMNVIEEEKDRVEAKLNWIRRTDVSSNTRMRCTTTANKSERTWEAPEALLGRTLLRETQHYPDTKLHKVLSVWEEIKRDPRRANEEVQTQRAWCVCSRKAPCKCAPIDGVDTNDPVYQCVRYALARSQAIAMRRRGEGMVSYCCRLIFAAYLPLTRIYRGGVKMMELEFASTLVHLDAVDTFDTLPNVRPVITNMDIWMKTAGLTSNTTVRGQGSSAIAAHHRQLSAISAREENAMHKKKATPTVLESGTSRVPKKEEEKESEAFEAEMEAAEDGPIKKGDPLLREFDHVHNSSGMRSRAESFVARRSVDINVLSMQTESAMDAIAKILFKVVPVKCKMRSMASTCWGFCVESPEFCHFAMMSMRVHLMGLVPGNLMASAHFHAMECLDAIFPIWTPAMPGDVCADILCMHPLIFFYALRELFVEAVKGVSAHRDLLILKYRWKEFELRIRDTMTVTRACIARVFLGLDVWECTVDDLGFVASEINSVLNVSMCKNMFSPFTKRPACMIANFITVRSGVKFMWEEPMLRTVPRLTTRDPFLLERVLIQHYGVSEIGAERVTAEIVYFYMTGTFRDEFSALVSTHQRGVLSELGLKSTSAEARRGGPVESLESTPPFGYEAIEGCGITLACDHECRPLPDAASAGYIPTALIPIIPADCVTKHSANCLWRRRKLSNFKTLPCLSEDDFVRVLRWARDMVCSDALTFTPLPDWIRKKQVAAIQHKYGQSDLSPDSYDVQKLLTAQYCVGCNQVKISTIHHDVISAWACGYVGSVNTVFNSERDIVECKQCGHGETLISIPLVGYVVYVQGKGYLTCCGCGSFVGVSWAGMSQERKHGYMCRTCTVIINWQHKKSVPVAASVCSAYGCPNKCLNLAYTSVVEVRDDYFTLGKCNNGRRIEVTGKCDCTPGTHVLKRVQPERHISAMRSIVHLSKNCSSASGAAGADLLNYSRLEQENIVAAELHAAGGTEALLPDEERDPTKKFKGSGTPEDPFIVESAEDIPYEVTPLFCDEFNPHGPIHCPDDPDYKIVRAPLCQLHRRFYDAVGRETIQKMVKNGETIEKRLTDAGISEQRQKRLPPLLSRLRQVIHMVEQQMPLVRNVHNARYNAAPSTKKWMVRVAIAKTRKKLILDARKDITKAHEAATKRNPNAKKRRETMQRQVAEEAQKLANRVRTQQQQQQKPRRKKSTGRSDHEQDLSASSSSLRDGSDVEDGDDNGKQDNDDTSDVEGDAFLEEYLASALVGSDEDDADANLANAKEEADTATRAQAAIVASHIRQESRNQIMEEVLDWGSDNE